MRALLGYPVVVVLTAVVHLVGAASEWSSWSSFFVSAAVALPITFAVVGDGGDLRRRRGQHPHVG